MAPVSQTSGCVAVAEVKREVLRLIREAIELHREDEDTREEDLPLRQPTTSEYFDTEEQSTPTA